MKGRGQLLGSCGARWHAPLGCAPWSRRHAPTRHEHGLQVVGLASVLHSGACRQQHRQWVQGPPPAAQCTVHVGTPCSACGSMGCAPWREASGMRPPGSPHSWCWGCGRQAATGCELPRRPPPHRRRGRPSGPAAHMQARGASSSLQGRPARIGSTAVQASMKASGCGERVFMRRRRQRRGLVAQGGGWSGGAAAGNTTPHVRRRPPYLVLQGCALRRSDCGNTVFSQRGQQRPRNAHARAEPVTWRIRAGACRCRRGALSPACVRSSRRCMRESTGVRVRGARQRNWGCRGGAPAWQGAGPAATDGLLQFFAVPSFQCRPSQTRP